MNPYKAWLIDHFRGLDIDIIHTIKILCRYSIIKAPSNEVLNTMVNGECMLNGHCYTSMFIHNGILLIGNTKFPIDGTVIGSGLRMINGKFIDIYYNYRRLNSVDYNVYIDIKKNNISHVENLIFKYCEGNNTDVYYINKNIDFVVFT